MRTALVVGVVACGPGAPQIDMRVAGRNALVEAANDPASLRELLRDSVINGGLWFDDAECATQFATPGEVRGPQLKSFARCLATLHLQASPREDALGDVTVMQYAPGFEVEARVVNEPDGPRLTWIGFESRRNADDNAPTITVAALEALRSAGDPTGGLAPEVAATLVADQTRMTRAAFSWLKICLDDTGFVRDAHVHETTSVAASKAFLRAVQQWSFRPFVIRGQPMPVCAMVRLASPPGQAPSVETLPLPPPPSRSKKQPIVFAKETKPTLLEGHRIAGEKQISPDDDTKRDIHARKIDRIIGSFRLCLDDTGIVESVLPLKSTGFAAYDRRLIAGMRTWVYSPYMVDGQPVPVCTAVTFIYSQG